MRPVWRAAALGLFLLLAASPALATDYYVAPPPTGDDGNAGTVDAPFASMARAQMAASAGDTCYFRDGVYEFTSSSSAVGITLSKSGNSGARIQYFAYEGEHPVLDFSGITTAARIKGISVTASYIYLKGFEIVNVPQNVTDQKESWGIHVNGGDENIFENLDIHDIMGPGLFIEEGGNNLVLNCDSHHNYDEKSYNGGPTPGENADGFGCHSSDAGNVFQNCRAWSNSDDGFDFINSPGVCVVEHSWAFKNGFIPDTTTAIGNGAGVKTGGFTNNVPATIPRHRALFNVSFGNRRQGFYANHHEGGLDFINNTAFDNGQRNFDLLADEGAAAHFLRNNIAFGSGGTVDNVNAGEVDDAYDSWNLSVQVSADDFASLDTSLASAPRQADGSLPAVALVHLVAGSDLIDAGEDQGFPYNDLAPDLGAFESGAPIDTGTGGTGASSGGSGGSAGGAVGGSTATGGVAGSAGNTGSAGSVGGGGTLGASGGANASAGSAGTNVGNAAGGATSSGAAPAGSTDDAGCACVIGKHRDSGAPAGRFVALVAGLLFFGRNLVGRRGRGSRGRELR